MKTRFKHLFCIRMRDDQKFWVAARQPTEAITVLLARLVEKSTRIRPWTEDDVVDVRRVDRQLLISEDSE